MYYPLIHFTPPLRYLAGAQRSTQEYSTGSVTTTDTSSCGSNTGTLPLSSHSHRQLNDKFLWFSCTDIPRVHLKCRRMKPVDNTNMQRLLPQYKQTGSVTYGYCRFRILPNTLQLLFFSKRN
ncbi:hypothetical protein WUBG_02526 [Wuchereria bancrofti]|uniref:Uncharacterized protein n=1 Tax=Wuchereria bancrofti TaxID=6293 RepID=J9BGZ6_WUCBA|nr:hypothetical protein WUBG_02526 [Wuchereria bancrofti]VDM07137.1 unnamed protein product [Wuchereria bancrofti]